MGFIFSLIVSLISFSIAFMSAERAGEKHRRQTKAIAMLIGSLMALLSLLQLFNINRSKVAIAVPGGNVGVVEELGEVKDKEMKPVVQDAIGSGQMSQTKTLVRENNSFALDLYQQLRKEEGNLFFSPFSISTALAMTYAGARNETAAEMAQVLHFSQEGEQLHKNFATILRNMQTESGEQLSIANRLWGQKGMYFLEEFVNITKNQYQAPIAEVDFISDSERESGRQRINDWVAEQTQQKIKDLLGPGSLNEDTRLVLTNAIYFKGDWALPFREENTKKIAFAISPDREVEVPMMYHSKVNLFYARLPELQVLELPYKEGKISMVVLLPKAVDGLGALEQQLTPEKLEEWLSSLDVVEGGVEVEVWLPKFQITSEFNMKETLSQMGMRLAFGDGADFSGINGKSNDLFISEVVHKAFVNVNEKGTEAAAATGVIGGARSGPEDIFRADRPFLFLIQEIETGSILFLGRVVNPLTTP